MGQADNPFAGAGTAAPCGSSNIPPDSIVGNSVAEKRIFDIQTESLVDIGKITRVAGIVMTLAGWILGLAGLLESFLRLVYGGEVEFGTSCSMPFAGIIKRRDGKPYEDTDNNKYNQQLKQRDRPPGE
jgi:hypothetical protein